MVGFVLSEAFSGNYGKNPYNFQNFNLSYLEILVNGKSVPGRPFQPDFINGDYTASFLSMFYGKYPSHGGNFIKRAEYPLGYTLFVFNIDSQATAGLMTDIKKAQTRLNVSFREKLPGAVTCILYAQYPDSIKIDKARNVIIS